MMSACRQLSIAGSVLLALVPTPGFSQRAERPIETTLCELVKSADGLNGKMVRVRALIVMGMESVILYDKACDADARVELDWPREPIPRAAGDGLFEYAFISSPREAERPERLRWRRPLPPVKLVEDETYARFAAALQVERPASPGVICVACPLNSVTATMTGRFEHATRMAVRDRFRKIEVVEPVGFGHLNMWTSRFILQSVPEFTAKPISASSPR